MVTGRQLDWKDLVNLFRVISAYDMLSMKEMKRHQDVRDKVRWLSADERPLALLFISHRWETLKHPDPAGKHLKAIQNFVRCICSCIEAMLVGRQERLQLVPSLAYEGVLQAEEVARRIFGFGPFSDGPACIGGRNAKSMVSKRFELYRNDRTAFHDWLLRNIGLWLDYICMPQKPLSPGEEPEFSQSLEGLDSLVMSSTLIALRHSGDDYPVRGWCASEFFLASARSFSRSLYIDTGRLAEAEEVVIPKAAGSNGDGKSDVTKVMNESFEQDRSAFMNACDQWSSFEGPLLQITPPDPWSVYRSLQGSSFYSAEFDPNPMRRALEAIRSLETALIQKWLMSDKPRLFDLGKEAGYFLQRHGMRCAIESDLVYLGFLLACHGWIDAFRPLLRECLQRYLEKAMHQLGQIDQDSIPLLVVMLKPIPEDVRALFFEVKPYSAETWNSRLSTGPGPDPQEKAVIKRVHEALNQKSPEFTFINSDDPHFSQKNIERLSRL